MAHECHHERLIFQRKLRQSRQFNLPVHRDIAPRAGHARDLEGLTALRARGLGGHGDDSVRRLLCYLKMDFVKLKIK
jgi:hypothetical protein